VQLKGAVTVTAGPTEKGGQKLSVSAPAGTYTLTVTARRNGELFAEGTAANVKIEAGKTTAVAIQMTLADGGNNGGDNGGVIIITPFEGSSIADFKAWLYALPENTPETAYNAKLNLDSLGPVGTLLGVNGSIRDAIDYYVKYLNLDLSGSTFNVITKTAFACAEYLLSVILPDTVTTIDNQAFYGCLRLTSITIPAGVTKIDNSAFTNCTGLTSVTFKGTITSDNISIVAFDGDLRDKYLAGGPGTYTRPAGGLTWTKTSP